MTQNTRAERLRKLIVVENEDSDSHGTVIASNLIPNTTSAIKVFVERLHAHETRIGPYHSGCVTRQIK